MNTKKVLWVASAFVLASFLIFVPTRTFASLDSNLSFGSRGPKVTELQKFLIEKGFLQGQPTGNFFSLTLKAVKTFQSANSISATGYVGMLTRTKVNNEMALENSSSTAGQIAKTSTTTLPININPQLTPSPAPVPAASSIDYSAYTNFAFSQYQNNPPGYRGQNIILTGMNLLR